MSAKMNEHYSEIRAKDMETLVHVIASLRESDLLYPPPPTVRQLANMADVKSTQTIHARLNRLRDSGLVVDSRWAQAGVVPTNAGVAAALWVMKKDRSKYIRKDK